MAQIIQITDYTPLFDGKIFYIRMDKLPGNNKHKIKRTFLGIEDTERTLVNENTAQIGTSAYNTTDTILVRYDDNDTTYRIINLNAAKAIKSAMVSNGYSVAGYIVENDNDINSNTENFEIPTGLRVGFGGKGSTENLILKGDIIVKTVNGDISFGALNPTPAVAPDFKIGDPLKYVSGLTTASSAFLGFGSLTQAYKKIGAAGSNPEYNSQSSVHFSLIYFDGKDTLLGGSTQSEYDEEDVRLIDLIDDDLSSVVGRFYAILVLNPNNNNLNWKVIDTNVQELIDSANYTVGVLPRYSNSISLGNGAFVSDSNQISLGTTGVDGTIVTDYTLKTTSGIETGFSWQGAMQFSVTGNSIWMGHNESPTAMLEVKYDEINFNHMVKNNTANSVPLRVEGITGTTTDLFQVWDDGVKVCQVTNDGVFLTGRQGGALGVPNNNQDEPFISTLSSLVTIGWGSDTIMTFSDGEAFMSTGTILTTGIIKSLRTEILDTGTGDSVSINKTGISGNALNVQKDGISKLVVNSSGQTIISQELICEGEATFEAPSVFEDDITIQTSLYVSNNLTLTAPNVPATATSPGSVGRIAWDADYIYVCVAANTWKRTALATW